MIQDWHAQQVSESHDTVAMLAVSVLACGSINSTGLAIEPVHAQIMLNELHAIMVNLEAIAGGQAVESISSH